MLNEKARDGLNGQSRVMLDDQEYARLVRRVSQKFGMFGGTIEDAQDAMQSAIVYFLEHPRNWESSLHFANAIYQKAQWLALDAHRHDSRTVYSSELSEGGSEDWDGDSDYVIDRLVGGEEDSLEDEYEAQSHMENILSRLTPAEQHLFERVRHGYSFSEIAEMNQEPIATCYKRWTRLLQRISAFSENLE